MMVPDAAAQTAVLWRRLDVAGHDAATIGPHGTGAELRGMAVFHDDRGPAALHYRVRCDGAYRTTDARITGWRGPRLVEILIERDEVGHWTLNGEPCAAAAGCLDLDLGFTPATNLLPLRRMGLGIGQSAEVRSAWLECPDGTLVPLAQRYTRVSTVEYAYEADLPGGERFAGGLRVAPSGWVLDYAGLWMAEGAV